MPLSIFVGVTFLVSLSMFDNEAVWRCLTLLRRRSGQFPACSLATQQSPHPIASKDEEENRRLCVFVKQTLQRSFVLQMVIRMYVISPCLLDYHVYYYFLVLLRFSFWGFVCFSINSIIIIIIAVGKNEEWFFLLVYLYWK